MAEISMEIKNCEQCPKVKIVFSDSVVDDFEVAWDYYCTEVGNRKVAEYIEHDWEMPSIPSWCPLKEEDN